MKSEAKSGNDEILEKLQETTKDAGITAEAAKVVEQPELPTEKPYIPETAAAEAVDASANVLDGNDSAAFKPARFASSGGGSTVYEQSRGDQSSGATTSENASNGSTVKVAKSGGKVEELEGKASATPASGKAEIRKETAKTGGNDNKGGDGSKTETGKGTLSDDNNASERKGETGNSSNNSGETGPETGETPVNVTTTTNVEDTVSTVVATTLKTSNPSFETLSSEKKTVFGSRRSSSSDKAAEAEQKRLLREKRNGLKQHFLQVLRNAFEKEADVDVDDVVPLSNRIDAGITSSEVMRLAAEPVMRAKRVTLYADESTNRTALIALLKELGAKRKGEGNPNLSFLLPNGIGFLNGDENIPGVKLETVSTAVRITFPNATPSVSDKKKPDAEKPTDTTKKATKPASGASCGRLDPDDHRNRNGRKKEFFFESSQRRV